MGFVGRKSLTLLMGAALASAAPRLSGAQQPAMIEGTVRDAGTNELLAGVKIELAGPAVPILMARPFGNPPPPPTATTNTQGHFAIQTTYVGSLRVVPTRNGYVFSRPEQKRAPTEPGVWVQVSAGQKIQNIAILMARPASISGRVVEANGNPMIGNVVNISLNRYTYSADGTQELRYAPGVNGQASGSTARPNDLGEFRFFDLQPGDYYLAVSGGATIGSVKSHSYYYPGGSDEAKAVPIRVNGGEDIKLGTISLPPRTAGTEVKIRITGPNRFPSGGHRIAIGGSTLFMTRPQDMDEIVMPPIAPGHYEIVVSNTPGGQGALLYAFGSLDVGNTIVEKEIQLSKGLNLTGTVYLENADGTRSPNERSIRCRFYSHHSGYADCRSSSAIPGKHRLEIDGLGSDDYVSTARLGNRDVLIEGANIEGDSKVEVVIATGGAIATGSVRDASGTLLPQAVVAIVPDLPYRATALRFRSVIADSDGRYEIHGIAPGSYRLFAWTELEGAAYLNADFMKEFEDRGKAVKAERQGQIEMDLTAF
jgi:protocatechuate 3,4-dioxygenase beta subunit